MAKNTTGSGTNVDGSTFVHTGNMGKTLVFDGMTYNVKVGDTLAIGEDGLVNVKLSPDSGNLLEVRQNGIGYWAVISENKNTFYVDALNGNDANTGLKDAPLKTINKACELLSLEDKSGDCYIFLKSKQDHRLMSSPAHLPKNNLVFITYDAPKYDYGHLVHNGNISALYTDFEPASIIVEQATHADGTSASSFYAKRILFYGVKLYQKFGFGTRPYGTYHIALTESGGDVILWGSDVYQESNGVAFRTSKLSLICSNYYNSGVSGKLTEIDTPPSLVVQTADHLRSSNYLTAKKSEIISPSQYDIATKRQFAFTTSWDFFNNPD